MKYPGLSFYNNNHTLPAGEMLPFVHAGNVSSSGNSTAAGFCLEGTLDPKKVQGKIVFCNRGENGRVAKGKVIKAVGGKGMVLADGITDVFPVADVHVLPAIAVDYETGKEIEKYLLSSSGSGNNNGNNTAKAATATMTFYGTRVGMKPSPVVASFSSRGPNPITPEILKPDLIAPGVNILAAWTGGVSQTKVENDPIVDFNIDSGTSMSCPHVSGIAAVLKAANPEWSPAAIRSALMTTAYMQYPDGAGTLIDDATRKQATPFDFGAGMVSPGLALNPGLVYDMNSRDYLHFLCPLNYTSKQLQTLTRDKSLTCDPKEIYSLTHLNYPSFAITFALHKGAAVIQQPAVTHVRTLTNVRDTVESYKVSVSLPTSSFVSISVEPEILSFNGKKDKKSYNVTFISNNKPPPKNTNVFGVIKWVSSDGKTTVQSPVAVSWYYDS
ncbi:unnamed protein product [Cuscuta epithymum]|uniref:Uncharacterized protein n=1 Tax=Cuscuta epithymum TaxID=186058 RepID=A0AAV0EL88_9ASTE|nr:unnamed protein product [Cuscuta epithymum]